MQAPPHHDASADGEVIPDPPIQVTLVGACERGIGKFPIQNLGINARKTDRSAFFDIKMAGRPLRDLVLENEQIFFFCEGRAKARAGRSSRSQPAHRHGQQASKATARSGAGCGPAGLIGIN